MSQFVRFVLVGVSNTVVGYAVIFGCMYGLGLSPQVSNLIGYAFGLVLSFVLNKKYTFRTLSNYRQEICRFLLVFCLAYGANLLVLMVLVRSLQVNAAVAQLLSGIFYIVVSYALNKRYVFVEQR